MRSRNRVAAVRRLESHRKLLDWEIRSFSSTGYAAHRPNIETGMRIHQVVIAVRGERLALTPKSRPRRRRSPGAPWTNFSDLYGIDEKADSPAGVVRPRRHGRRDGRTRCRACAVGGRAPARTATAKHGGARIRARLVALRGRDWDAMAASVADNHVGIDHRRVVSAETQHGREAVIRDLQAAADVGFAISMVSAMAIRGERLVLARVRASGSDPEAIQNDALNVVEIDTADRIAKVATFDVEDFDAAIAELDSGTSQAKRRRRAPWSVVAGAYVASSDVRCLRRQRTSRASTTAGEQSSRPVTWKHTSVPAGISQ